MCTTCYPLLNKELIIAMAYNDGAGPDDQRTCNAIAEIFKALLETQPDGFIVESGMRVDKKGRFLSPDELSHLDSKETYSPYVTEPSSVRRWIQFLRHCGGFHVC